MTSSNRLHDTITHCSNLDQLVKVVNVDVDKHSVQPRQDLLANRNKYFGKRCFYNTKKDREREREKEREREGGGREGGRYKLF